LSKSKSLFKLLVLFPMIFVTFLPPAIYIDSIKCLFSLHTTLAKSLSCSFFDETKLSSSLKKPPMRSLAMAVSGITFLDSASRSAEIFSPGLKTVAD
jgi:hypothetical protein